MKRTGRIICIAAFRTDSGHRINIPGPVLWKALCQILLKDQLHKAGKDSGVLPRGHGPVVHRSTGSGDTGHQHLCGHDTAAHRREEGAPDGVSDSAGDIVLYLS